MTALDLLERRRDLVVTSCDLQRATLAGHLARIERHRGFSGAAAVLRAALLVRRFIRPFVKP